MYLKVLLYGKSLRKVNTPRYFLSQGPGFRPAPWGVGRSTARSISTSALFHNSPIYFFIVTTGRVSFYRMCRMFLNGEQFISYSGRALSGTLAILH